MYAPSSNELYEHGDCLLTMTIQVPATLQLLEWRLAAKKAHLKSFPDGSDCLSAQWARRDIALIEEEIAKRHEKEPQNESPT